MIAAFTTEGPLGITHSLAHVVIFLSYIAAMVVVPVSFKRLMYLSPWTQVFGGGFFLFCGITHFGIFIDKSQSLFFAITDHFQAGCIVGFLVFLSSDLARAQRRLTRAMVVIRYHLDDKTADQVQSTIVKALRDKE